jgi:hypothetical protein
MEACFLVSEPDFAVNLSPCKTSPDSRNVYRPIYLLEFTVQRSEQDRSAFCLPLIASLALNSSERRRQLALASGIRVLRSFGIDRLHEPAHAAGTGWQAQMAEDLDDHRRIVDRDDYLQSAAAVRAVGIVY